MKLEVNVAYKKAVFYVCREEDILCYNEWLREWKILSGLKKVIFFGLIEKNGVT